MKLNNIIIINSFFILLPAKFFFIQFATRKKVENGWKSHLLAGYLLLVYFTKQNKKRKIRIYVVC